MRAAPRYSQCRRRATKTGGLARACPLNNPNNECTNESVTRTHSVHRLDLKSGHVAGKRIGVKPCAIRAERDENVRLSRAFPKLARGTGRIGAGSRRRPLHPPGGRIRRIR